MQELLVDFVTSLDGYGVAEGWPGWWGTRRTRVSRLARPAAGTRLHDLDGSEHVPCDVRIRHRIQGVGLDGYPDVTLEMVASRTFDGRLHRSSTSPRCSPVHPARTPPPERALLLEPRDVREGMTGVVLLQRVAACCRREHQNSEVARDLRPI